MKRWCKRPPASPETGSARQAPPGATPIGAMTRPAELQVGGNEPAGDGRPRWMAAPDRIPLTDRLPESPANAGFSYFSGTGVHHRHYGSGIAVAVARWNVGGKAWLRANEVSGPRAGRGGVPATQGDGRSLCGLSGACIEPKRCAARSRLGESRRGYRRNSRSVSFASLCGPGVAVSWPPRTLMYLLVPPTTVSRVRFVQRWMPRALSWPPGTRNVAVS